jgi:hypothetical protein
MPLLWHNCGILKADLIGVMEVTVAQVLKLGAGTGKALTQQLFYGGFLRPTAIDL